MDRQRVRNNVLIPCVLLLVVAICIASYGIRQSGDAGAGSKSNSTKVPVEVMMQYEALPANSAKQRHAQVIRTGSKKPAPPFPWPWHLPRLMQQHKSSSNSSLAVRATSAIMQSTIDYWVDCCTRWSERLGLREDPVLELLRSAARSAVPTEEERKKLQEQREWYYHDSSVFYVMLTLRLGLLGFFLSLFAFESLLQGWIFGDLGQALAVPRLFFSPAKAAELSFQGFGSSVPVPGRKPRGYKRAVLRRIITGQVPCRLHQLLRRVMTLEDSNIVDSAGMDALILLRFCALCGRFCALTAVWCLVLVPVYSAGRRAEGSLSLYSLSNVPSESWRLWLVVPTAYLCNLTLCGLLWKEYEHFVKLRRNFLGGDNKENHDPDHAGAGGDSQWPSRPVTSRSTVGRAASSPSLVPHLTLKPFSADNPQNPNFSPELRPVASASFFEPVSPALDVNSVHVNWSRGVTPPRLLFVGDASCQPSGACSPAPWQAAAASQTYANVSMAMVREQARRSVVLEQLPRSLRDPGALRSCLDDLLGHNAVLCVSFAPSDSRRLSEWVEERIKLRSQSTQLSKVLLMRMEDRLTERRDDFARAMTSSKMALRFGPGPSSFLSVFSLPESVEPIRTPERARRSRMRHSDTGSVRSSNCLGWASTAMLSCRTGCRALCSSLRTVSWVMREVAGTSLRQVNALVPTSALDTPAQTTAGTPLAGIAPADRQVSFGVCVQEELPSTAFVTFRTMQAACVACQVVLDEDPVRGMGMQVSPAPEPRDVVWHNVARLQAQLLVRQFFVEIALLFGLAFWSVPVSLIQVWCSSERLSALLPGLQLPESMRGTDLEALVTLYMPVLSLLALLELLPIMLHRLASRYEGVKSYSALQMRTMRRYWRFQLATIGVTVLSGSVSNSLTAMLDQPTSMLWELGQSLPQVAVYFLATVLSSALVVGPVSLLRLPLLAQLTWTALTRRLREIFCLHPSPSAQVESNFLAAAAEDCLDTPPMAADLSALLLVLLVCVTYASIAPLIILAGALFFALRWLVLALRYLYVHVPRFDSGGAFWYLLWNQAVLALILGDFTTLAAVALRSGYAQLPFLLPLPLLPIAFSALANFRFAKPSQRLSLRAARMVDARADPNLSERFPLDAYWHPALRHPADERDVMNFAF